MEEIQNVGEQPVENTPTQTLFRFVSVRSPQISDEKDQNKRFILIPSELKDDNKFYKPVTEGSGSKRKLLQECAALYANNTECISKDKLTNNLESFKRSYKEIYNFATWVAKNKSICTYQEFTDYRDAIINSSIVYPGNTVLWNNLIYQVVTQKEFYIKEAMMQIILAIHILQSTITDEDEARLLLASRVVLPKELMLDEKNTSTSHSISKAAEGEVKQTFPSEEMKKQQAISSAKMKLNRVESLRKSLTLAEKKYRKEYQTEFEIQDKAHQNKVAPIIEKYNADLLAAKEDYCGVRPPGEEYNPEDPCRQPKEVPYPKLPKFDFTFRDEVAADSLATALKQENIEALLDILGYKFDSETSQERMTEDDISKLDGVLEGRNTFVEINTAITEHVEKLNKVIVENTQGNEEAYTSIGGVIIPVSKTLAATFTYQICPNYIYKGYTLDMSLTVPDSSWDVSYISTAFIPGNNPSTTLHSEHYVKSRIGNTIYLNDIHAPGLDFYEVQGGTLGLKILFSNGRNTEIIVHNTQARACASGNFIFEVEENENPEIIDDENIFIPSGFGFKQIGIADYLKVEQSTHAYVEGEVANIENIMAREYREKSTRRLRRSENTTTTSSDTEREQLTDTTTANRYEMQNEISKMMQEASDFGAFTNASYSPTNSFSLNAGANYANHNSKEESTRKAVTEAMDITSRAMDRIVTKVHEERIEKIIDEFEENNSHGFDNRKGDKHVVGVYRWVDKLMKNQIYNYGKRMMFEFMIPEPAKLYRLPGSTSTLIKPEDPRKSSHLTMADYSSLGASNGDAILKYWAGKYNVEIEEKPAALKNIGYSFAEKIGNNVSNESGVSAVGRFGGVYNKDFKVPENYAAINISGDVKIRGGSSINGFAFAPGGTLSINNQKIFKGSEIDFGANSENTTFFNVQLEKIEENVGLSVITWDIQGVTGSVVLKCIPTPKFIAEWQQKTFNAIITAFENALSEYNNAYAEEENKATSIKDSNPNFYRQIENTILRKNCISYMADRNSNSTHGYGLSGLTQGSTFTDYETKLSNDLDKYTAFIKFMEQAFEWENLSYYLYPYYWGNKQNWLELYQSENTDPLFKSFLQSGMARVVATVRPGFEDAVQFYLATGKIWNGGEVPVIGDELYLSIVDEMKEPKGVKQGKAWLTRIPTTLNILQANSIGLKVAHALPFSTENPDDFEVPSEVITEEKFNFEENDHLLGTQPGEEEKIISGDWV